MAGFSFKSFDISECAQKIKHLQVFDIPLNVSGNIIGEGSSAVVFKHMLRGKPAAVKKFKQLLSKKALLKAASALLRLKHQNVCRFRGYSLRPSALLFEYCYIQMDEDSNFIIHDLKQLITLFNDHDYFSFSERKDYCIQICKGLDYLHSMGVVHKDLKPSNVLVNGSKEDIQLKISDFSEVAVFKDTILTTLTKHPLHGMTLAYVSPELIKGDTEGSAASDIYALGFTMFEVLSNLNSPWDGMIPFFTDLLLKEKILAGERPNVNIIKQLYGNDVNPICSLIPNCWSENLHERPDAKYIINMLETKTEDSVLTPVTSKNIATKKTRKRKNTSSIKNNNEISKKEKGSVQPKCAVTLRSRRGNTDEQVELAKQCCKINSPDQDGLVKLFVNEKIGYGVFTSKKFTKKSFLLEYKGMLGDANRGEEALNTGDTENGSFIYFFKYKDEKWSIDATNSTSLGRWINDSPSGKANCKMQLIEVEEEPHLCLFAVKDIDPYTELRYDYCAPSLSWRKDKNCREPVVLNGLENIKPVEAKNKQVEKLSGFLPTENIDDNMKPAKVKKKHLENLCDFLTTENAATDVELLETKKEQGKNLSGSLTPENLDANMKPTEVKKKHVENLCDFLTTENVATDVELLETKKEQVKNLSGSLIPENLDNNMKSTEVKKKHVENLCDFLTTENVATDVELLETKKEQGKNLSGSLTPENLDAIPNNPGLPVSLFVTNMKPTEVKKKHVENLCDFLTTENVATDVELLETKKEQVKNLSGSLIPENLDNNMKSTEVKKKHVENLCDFLTTENVATDVELLETKKEQGKNLSGSLTPESLDANIKPTEVKKKHVENFCDFLTTENVATDVELLETKKEQVKNLSGSLTPENFDAVVQDSSDEKDVKMISVLPDIADFTDFTVEYVKGKDKHVTICDEDESFLCEEILDRDIENDSGLFGDHPSFLNTDDEEDNNNYIPEFSESELSDDCDETYEPPECTESSSEFSGNSDEDRELFGDEVVEDEVVVETTRCDGSAEADRSKENVISNAVEKKVGASIKTNDEERPGIVVAKTSNLKYQRQWDKDQFCVYCGARRSKMARHLEDVHKNEIDVAAILAVVVDKKDPIQIKKVKRKQRFRNFERLRKRGNFNHNMEVLKTEQGVLIVEKRPSTNQSHVNYLPCEFCLGFYHKRELGKHMKRCFEKPVNFKVEGRVQSAASMLLYASEIASADLKKVLSKMIVDDVSLCVKSDRLIIQYGNKMCVRLRKEGDQQHHISNKLRELARLVLESRKCCEEVSCLKDCINPKYFDFVIEGTTELCGWNEEEGVMTNPSIGIKLGWSLKKCAKIIKGEGIRNGIKSLKTMADEFNELLKLSWNDEISRAARTELDQRKWNKPLLLPLTKDLQLLKKNLKNTLTSAVIALGRNNTNVEEYRNLCTSVLSLLILFNRRRAGEPARMKIEDMGKMLGGEESMNDEVKDSLSPFERKLCAAFKRIELRGKRGRKVPLLLTKEVENSINLLIKLRKVNGANPNNPFVFPVLGNGSVKNVRGPDAIRKHVKLCNLKCPEAIYSTNLRKHVATLSQLLNLEKQELEILATFLGHDIEIHKQYYRLPEDTLQLAKCSKLLLLMEQGGVGRQHGKTLQEIEVDIEDVVEDYPKVKKTDHSKEDSDVLQAGDAGDAGSDTSDSNQDELPKPKKQKKPVKNWTDEEVSAIKKHLNKFLLTGNVPRKKDIDPALVEKALSRRGWKDVKNYIHNKNKSQKQKLHNTQKKNR